jgi:hypothetical protein
MKPKIFVAIALMLSILVAGLIIIVGFSSKVLLPIYLLLFLLVFFAIGIYVMRDLLTDKIIIAGIIVVILSISVALFMTNLKNYYDATSEYTNPQASSEINLMQSQNDYYLAYAEYLGQRISEYQNQTSMMENKLKEMKRLRLETTQQEVVVTTPPPVETVQPIEYIYYYDDDRENEREEYDD